MTVAVTKNTGLVTTGANNRSSFDDQQIAILKASYAKDLSPMEFKVYLETASALRLNPFSREIFSVKFGGVMQLVTSIDGYRKLSARSGRFMGVTNGRLRVKTKDGDSVTIPHEEFDPDAHTIISGTIGVRVADWPEPVEATAVFKTFKKDTATWKSMPDLMILKCAEAAAHRKAALLPDLGAHSQVANLYVDDELQDYSVVDVKVENVEPPKPKPIEEHKPSKRVDVRDSIVETVPETPKKKEELPPLEPEIVQEIKDILEPTEIDNLMEKVRKTYISWGAGEDGLLYAENRILDKFGVNDFNEITDIKELRKFCANDLKKELEQESYLPIKMTEE